MKRIIILLLIAITVCSTSYAVTDYMLTANDGSVVPESPRAARFIEVTAPRAALVTGATQFNIPLYTLAVQELSMSFDLLYLSNGVKVYDDPFPISYGWTLTPALRVTRRIQGRPDEFFEHVEYAPSRNGNEMDYTNSYRCVADSGINTINTTTTYRRYDAEKDIFTVHLPDRNVTFLADFRNGTPVIETVNSADVRIEADKHLTYIKVTDGNGVVYTFGRRGEYCHSDLYCNEWLLTQITLLSGDKVTLDWTKYNHNVKNHRVLAGNTVTYSHTVGGHIQYEEHLSENNLSPLTPLGNFTNQHEVSAVEFPGERVDFTYTTVTGGPRMTGMTVKNTDGEIVKSAELRYNAGLLTEVEVSGIGRYDFGYYDAGNVNEYGQDLWGYYNGDPECLTLVPRMQLRPNENVQYLTISGSARYTDVRFMKHRLLNRVTYPTGGYTMWEHEMHRFDAPQNDAYIAKFVTTSSDAPHSFSEGGGLRVTKITTATDSTDQTPFVTTYIYGKDGDGKAVCTDFPLLHTFVTGMDYVAAIWDRQGQGGTCLAGTETYTQLSVNIGSDYLKYKYGIPIWYEKVTEITDEGKTEHFFELKTEPDRVSHTWIDVIPQAVWSIASKGPQEVRTVQYKGHPDSYTRVHTVESAYDLVTTNAQFTNYAIRRRLGQMQDDQMLAPDFGEKCAVILVDNNFFGDGITDRNVPICYSSEKPGEVYAINSYSIFLVQEKLVSQTATDHLTNGDVTTKVEFAYRDDSDVPQNVMVTLPDGSTRRVELFYPATGSDAVQNALVAHNLGNTPIRTTLTETIAGQSVTKTVENVYGFGTAQTVPRVTETRAWRGDSKPVTLARYGYDRRGNLVWRTERDNVKTEWTWDATGTHPVSQTVGGRFVTRLEWKPLVGVTAQTTPFGSVTRYSYDADGRITSEAVDNYGTLNTYTYNLTRGNATITTAKWLDSAGASKIVNTAHFDGLGRQWLVVSAQAGGITTDVATMTEYDAMSRPFRTWSPVPLSDGTAATPQFVVQMAVSHYNDDNPYTKVTYEPSERELAESKTPPGAAWHTAAKAQSVQRRTNDVVASSRYSCPLFALGTDNSVVYKGLAPKATLNVSEEADEDGHTVLTFTDGRGQTLMTRSIDGDRFVDTRYIYNGYGDLVGVLPPKLATKSYAASAAELEQYAYFYRYDETGLCVYKKFPGRDAISLAYDPAGRLVATQDGNQRKQNDWTVYFYDQYGRDAITADVGALDSEIESFADSINFVTYTGAQELCGYSPAVQLPFEPTVRTAEFYDNYDFTTMCSDLRNTTDNVAGLLDRPTGLRTGGYDGTYEVVYYDHTGRQSLVNSLTAVGRESLAKVYTYAGAVETTTSTVGTSSLKTDYAYDNVGRPQSVTSVLTLTDSLTGTATVSLAYDKIGILGKVTFGSKCRQEVTRDCGGRETQRTIHLPGYRNTLQRNSLTSGSLQPGIIDLEMLTDVVSEQLLYADAPTPCYNGNVAQRRYGDATWTYAYDNLNRLTSARYSSDSHIENFSTEYAYDDHANIVRLKKYGLYDPLTGDCAFIDDLHINYDGNRAISIEDYGIDPVFDGAGGYNAPDGTGAMTYDANGNVITDTGRGITRITYNHLNQPVEIYFGDGHRQRIDYDGRGNKRRVTYSTATTPVLSGGTARRYRTDYVRRYGAGRIMRGDSVETVMPPYGYFDGTGRVRYQLHDYQGNVTMVVDEHGNVLQHTRYYPFGEAIDTFAASKVGALGDVATADATQPRLYGGKELERMHGLNEYDFAARRLPASLPQWTTPDPCLEQYYPLSPYAYCAGNPLRYTDPSGCYFTYSSTEMILAFLSHLQTLKVASAINLKTQLQNIFTALKNGENVKGYVKNANIEIAGSTGKCKVKQYI